MNTKSSKPEPSAELQLVNFFCRNGYMRVPNKSRRKKEPSTYKMGYEIRLVAKDKGELALIRRLLKSVDIKPGSPFEKSNQWCQPIYGKSALQQFTQWLDEFDKQPKTKRTAKMKSRRKKRS
jgi:hypothetical protein